MKTHKLKIDEHWFNDIIKGLKKFEIRINDRDFKLGDSLELSEIIRGEENKIVYTGRQVRLKIKYILHGADIDGLDKDYCILGF